MTPLLDSATSVDWWFAFKFNAATYRSTAADEPGHALFGGRPNVYKDGFCLQYASASSKNPNLQFAGASSDIGTTLNDPLGATFNQIYNGTCNFVVWNDQFYGSPIPSEGAPWGHSKGTLAWDDAGNGFVLQVSTPSWPGSGSARTPRANDGNTLGCVTDDNVEVSQHFFSVKLDAAGVATVLRGLVNSSVVTKQAVPQLINLSANCPNNLRLLAGELGKKSNSQEIIRADLTSTGGSTVAVISKPSALHVPPWQMVSSVLGGVSLRVASWWEDPRIPSTQTDTPCACWNSQLSTRGAVEIATTGTWQGASIGLVGGDGPKFNHAKIGVSTTGAKPLCIFGDLNQQGTLNGNAAEHDPCASSQNGRGGMFYVLESPELHASLTELLKGQTA